ncbi:MAG: acyl-CoA synthetase [Pseudomonadota bacterium]
MLHNVGQILSERARLSPRLEAIVDLGQGVRYDYQALEHRANRLAHGLRGAGIMPGARVGLLMANGHHYIEAYYALAKMGAIAVMLNWRLTPAELDYIVNDCAVSAILYTDDLTDLANALKPLAAGVERWLAASDFTSLCKEDAIAPPASEVGGKDPVFIMYTSGTTGRPKGAVMSHAASIAWHHSAVTTSDTQYGERVYTVAPLFHIAGIAIIKLAIMRGMTNVIDVAFDPDRAWDVLAAERVNIAFFVPAMLNFMLKSPLAWRRDLKAFRGILVGAAPVPVNLIAPYSARGIKIYQVYGATETHGGICLMPPEDALAKAGSTGKAYFGMDVRVVDGAGCDVPPGVPGEVITRGPHLLTAYWNKPEATAKALRDGWFHLGDIAEVDEDGFIYIRDRLKDMIISGGENIYPAEVEDVILSHPAVREVAVIGQPSEKWGESPVAIVVLKAGVAQEEAALAADIIAFCKGRLARYKQPKAVEFIDEIPRNPSGKALKRLLRQRFPGPAPQ